MAFCECVHAVLITHLMGVRPQRNTKGACKTKVGDLELSVFVDEQVLWLQISVEDTAGMEVVDTLDKLQGRHTIRQVLSAKPAKHEWCYE